MVAISWILKDSVHATMCMTDCRARENQLSRGRRGIDRPTQGKEKIDNDGKQICGCWLGRQPMQSLTPPVICGHRLTMGYRLWLAVLEDTKTKAIIWLGSPMEYASAMRSIPSYIISFRNRLTPRIQAQGTTAAGHLRVSVVYRKRSGDRMLTMDPD